MIKNYRQKNTGFVALISAIIISVVLLLIATNLSLTSFYNRFNILDTELKTISTNLAEACANSAILKFASKKSYAGGEDITVGGNTCTILQRSISEINQVNPLTFETTADYQHYVTRLKVELNGYNLSVVSWQEI